MIAKTVAFALIASSMCTAAALAEEKADTAALAKALTEASVSLEQGLKASEAEGKPISAKFEIEHGSLQLSVYAAKGDKFTEVIVDHKSGSVSKSETITDAGDLKHAKVQKQAMAKTKSSLQTIVQDVVKDNGGFRAVSAMPMARGGQAVVEVTLMKGTQIKKVAKKLP